MIKLRTGLAVVALGAGLSWFGLSSREAPADPRRALAPPPVVLLEGAPGGAETRVVMRAPAAAAQPVVLGVVPHVAGSARRGTLDLRGPGGAARVFVVAAERESRRGSTYQSALWRVEAGAPAARLVGGLTDGSRALVTGRGALVVQRGRDGEDLAPVGRVLRERVDALSLDVVDPANGAARPAWTGRGMIAFLAAPLRGDEVLVYHVHERGAALFALDVGARSERPLVPAMDALARDFSYDPVHDEVAFVRAGPRGDWEVVSLPAHGPPVASDALRVRWRASSDHLMPRALRDGSIVVSLPDDRGLGAIEPWPRPPSRIAPLGDGSDEALAESDDGRWIAFRHRTPGRELLGLHARADGRTVSIDRPDVECDFVGFAPGALAPGGAP